MKQTGRQGWAPLHLAVQSRDEANVQALLAAELPRDSAGLGGTGLHLLCSPASSDSSAGSVSSCVELTWECRYALPTLLGVFRLPGFVKQQ